MHKHEWQERLAGIDSGRQGKKKGQRSDGFVCGGCKLTAKTPTNAPRNWRPLA
jgi:hypothetical protein